VAPQASAYPRSPTRQRPEHHKIKYQRRTTSGAAGNGLSRCQELLIYPFTTSALHSPCLVRASFANKQNSTAEGWGLEAQCLCVEPELPPCVYKQNPHQHYEWSEQQDAIGNLDYSAVTLPGESRRKTTSFPDGLRMTTQNVVPQRRRSFFLIRALQTPLH
jgi:hypothetical protein